MPAAVSAVILALLLPAACYLWMISSEPARESKLDPLLGRHYAHRGLYRKDQTVAENSLEAFLLAADHGYGIELDVQFSSDEQVVVFHDDSLLRMCGVDAPVCSRSYKELTSLRLGKSPSIIPLFSEVLAAVNGAVPMIVEIKSGKKNDKLCEKTLELLKAYEGPVCVESFNPLIVRWFKKHAGSIGASFRKVTAARRLCRRFFALRSGTFCLIFSQSRIFLPCGIRMRRESASGFASVCFIFFRLHGLYGRKKILKKSANSFVL